MVLGHFVLTEERNTHDAKCCRTVVVLTEKEKANRIQRHCRTVVVLTEKTKRKRFKGDVAHSDNRRANDSKVGAVAQ